MKKRVKSGDSQILKMFKQAGEEIKVEKIIWCTDRAAEPIPHTLAQKI